MRTPNKKWMLFLAFVLVVGMLLSSCGSPAEEKTPAGTTETPEIAHRPLKIRLSAFLVSTDWEKTTQVEHMKVIWGQVFEGLYGVNEAEGGYYNELAKEIKISEDQLTYTITLVDATFQNGEPLKASDVVFSYNRAINNPRFNYITSMIESVSEIDDKTVQIKLSYPFSAFAHTLFSVKIVSEKEVTEAGENFGNLAHTAGTGPYYISEYDHGTGLKLKAYEGYWGGAPNIKDVEYVVITEDSAAVIAFENKDIDLMHDAPTGEWEALEKAAGGNSTILKGNSIRIVMINWQSQTNNNILGNQLVREAMFYAINKENVLQAATNGYGAVANEYIPSEYVATSPRAADGGFKIYDYNPDKSRELLKQAGFTDEDLAKGIPVGTLSTYGAQTGEKAKAATVIQANLAEVGLVCNVEVGDASIITPRLRSQDFDFCVYGDSGNFDFNNIRQQVHSESVGMAVVNYRADNSPIDYERVEELCTLGVSTTDIPTRLKYYTELWSIISDSATILPYLNMPVGVVWAEDLDVGKLSPSYYQLKLFSWK